jgi:phage N-6-adenine-methyltransferase
MPNITPSEQDDLTRLELVIQAGFQTFVQVGNALMEIRGRKLYRQTHNTFEDYCRERWGIQRAHAYRLIDAAQVIGNLSPIGDILPATESQARPLTSLAPDSQREVWVRAVETAPNGKPTALHIENVVQAHQQLAPRMAVHYSSNTDDWSTPQDLFDRLHTEFQFTLDVCATATNAKCPDYFTPTIDGLLQVWQGVCWMNPPYGGAIPLWIEKAHRTASDGHADVVCLVPARTDTEWWWNHCIQGEVRFLKGRLKFGDGQNAAPFPSAVVVFYKHLPATKRQVIWWRDGL